MTSLEGTHHVGGGTVVVRRLTSADEYRITIDGDKYEVFRGNPTDPGTNPDLWYTEIGGTVEGPWDTADNLIRQVFLTEDGF